MTTSTDSLATARLLLEPAASGMWNMAVDEALLEAAASGEGLTLRLYEWDVATVSLGYFQRETPEIEPGGRFADLPSVRRLSGGGAILHHLELTYSIVIPATHPLAEAPPRLYDEMHGSITAALGEQGVAVQPRGESDIGDKAFLCFARGDRRDLVCDGFKVVGSAQRRRGRAILQHGSILLATSPLAPEFPGLQELCGRGIDTTSLRVAIARHSEPRLSCRWMAGTLTNDETDRTEEIVTQRIADRTFRHPLPPNEPLSSSSLSQ